MFLVFIEKFDQKSDFQTQLARTKPYKSRMGSKLGENIVFQKTGAVLHSFYVNYYWLNLFLVLIRKFDQKSNFQPWLAWTGAYNSRIGNKRGENIVFKSPE